MSRLKRWIRDLLGFSSTETNAFIILLPLMGIIIFAQPVYLRFFNSDRDDLAKDQLKLDSIVAQWEHEQKQLPDSDQTELSSKKISPFDPNKATSGELHDLGFSAGLAKRIVNYRDKGGRFKTKSDLLKIYGMDTTLYNQLYASISLPVTLQAQQTENDTQKKLPLPKTKFNLNAADTAVLKMINGIGPVLAVRIVKYRESLGGFIKPEQVHEIYGLDSIVVNRLLNASFIDQVPLKQININDASEAELDFHPYLNKTMAKAVVTYRFQHGRFKNVEEIRNIVLIKNELADRLIPYLKID
jgi:competence protein ComEA